MPVLADPQGKDAGPRPPNHGLPEESTSRLVSIPQGVAPKNVLVHISTDHHFDFLPLPPPDKDLSPRLGRCVPVLVDIRTVPYEGELILMSAIRRHDLQFDPPTHRQGPPEGGIVAARLLE
jgi:hypothetical protein